MTNNSLNEISFSNPGIYRIDVLGNILLNLFNHFDGEIGQVIEDENGMIITSLKVRVRDQAELSGLINMLYNLRLVLLSVNVERCSKNKNHNQFSELFINQKLTVK